MNPADLACECRRFRRMYLVMALRLRKIRRNPLTGLQSEAQFLALVTDYRRDARYWRGQERVWRREAARGALAR